MVTVILLAGEGINKHHVGHVEFASILLPKPEDVKCVPPDLISFADAVQIAKHLSEGNVLGQIGVYEWRKL